MSAANKKNMAGGGPSAYSSMNTYNEQDRRKILESLTADELATFQEAFTVFDKNQDGTITTKVREQWAFFKKEFLWKTFFALHFKV